MKQHGSRTRANRQDQQKHLWSYFFFFLVEGIIFSKENISFIKYAHKMMLAKLLVTFVQSLKM